MEKFDFLPPIVTMIGLILTFIIGLANLFFLIKKSRKENFINNVTSARLKYIQELRVYISQFCGLVYTYNLGKEELKDDKLFDFHKEADRLKYLLKLYLNPEDEYWDTTIINLIDEIIHHTDKDPNDKINELMTITQYLLKFEWEGAKKEAEKGVISELEKKDLYNKYVELHKNYLKRNKKIA